MIALAFVRLDTSMLKAIGIASGFDFLRLVPIERCPFEAYRVGVRAHHFAGQFHMAVPSSLGGVAFHRASWPFAVALTNVVMAFSSLTALLTI